MDTDVREGELAAKLRRLDAAGAPEAPGFDYQGMLDRHAPGMARARRGSGVARAPASARGRAMIAGSAGPFTATVDRSGLSGAEIAGVAGSSPQHVAPALHPRLVRADTYLALAALEDHIATIDDALSDARLFSPRGAEVARLERTRAELLDSYTRVRYAERVSANF